MSEKQALFWIQLAIALVLLLALSFALRGAKGLDEGQASGAEASQVSMDAEVQGSEGAEEQSAIRNPKSKITVTYSYDAAGRLVGADYGESGNITYTYDAAGNLLQRQVVGANYPAYLPVIMR